MASPDVDDLRRRRDRLERTAVTVFGVGALTEAIVCGAIIVSGWFAGVMDDRFERVFWAGAILSFVMVAVLATGAMPGGADDARTVRRLGWTLRVGLALFILAPLLCIGSLIADFYG